MIQSILRNEKQKTSAFYIATHALSVHIISALMALSDTNHWAIFDPSSGCILDWEVGLSTSVRMTPKDQIAGAAFVIDSIVVLCMLVSEELKSLLSNIRQLDSLVRAFYDIRHQ